MLVAVALPPDTEHQHVLRVMGMKWLATYARWEGRMCSRRIEALRKALPAVTVQTP